MDRNGTAETISNIERLKQYQCVDFSKPQSYEKVLRIYNRDSQGNIHANVHSYHENGQPKQFLEVVNSRAFGAYKEWHLNGCIKLQACVIGGEADLTPTAEESWLFDGCAYAWDEEGSQIATFSYEKGILQGNSYQYHPNGQIWKKIPYQNNEIHGSSETYLENCQLLQQNEYFEGARQGSSYRYWTPKQLASEEEYQKDTLRFGRYYEPSGHVVSEINDGNGYRSIFCKTGVAELHEYRHGEPDGEVKVFGTDQKLFRKYHVKNSQKNGEEIEYYENPHLRHLPKISLSWYQGKVQGIVKTWYDNGVQESKREMSNNTKNGISTAWYRDGNLMLIEEYDHDKLVKGEYYPKSDKHPISIVKEGKGVATLFDPEGNYVRKVHYENGTPTKTE